MLERPTPPWAVKSEKYDEFRTNHKHDVDEIVYKHCFRKLAQKTQVIVRPDKDTFRTRLSHTFEVAQIADNFGYNLELNCDLIKAIAFAHDLGHPPFAHVGETTLNRLLSEWIDRTLSYQGKNKEDKSKIINSFKFSHPQNSCRILLRKMDKITQETLVSVVGHSWSPWKDCLNCATVDDIIISMNESIKKSEKNYGTFLKCYEAQAVAISDQIAGLNSDIEDLIRLAKETEFLTKDITQRISKLQIHGINNRKIRDIAHDFILNYRSRNSKDRGWGRKERIKISSDSIIQFSKEKVQKSTVNTSQDNPLTPDPEIAVVLDIMERVVRRHIFLRPDIRHRDSLAGAAITTMFHWFFTLAMIDFGVFKVKNAQLYPHIIEDFDKWLYDYKKEIKREKEVPGVNTHPHMKNNVISSQSWREIEPAICAVDYLSELTDRFVVDYIFREDSLQRVLLENFGTTVGGNSK